MAEETRSGSRDRKIRSTLEGRAFPTTRWSLIRDAADKTSDSCRESLDHFASLYWRPVYSYIRRKWSVKRDEAMDLAQEFFAALCRRDSLAGIAFDQGRFRSYVMAALDNLVVSEHRRRNRRKRGGGVEVRSLETGSGLPSTDEESPERVLQREWARAILRDALKELEHEYRAKGQPATYEILRLRDVDGVPDSDRSYRALADRFGVSLTDVANRLRFARQRLREALLARIGDTVTSRGEAEAEMQELFGR